MAIAAWRELLQGRFRLLDRWCAFMTSNYKQLVVTEDTWTQVRGTEQWWQLLTGAGGLPAVASTAACSSWTLFAHVTPACSGCKQLQVLHASPSPRSCDSLACMTRCSLPGCPAVVSAAAGVQPHRAGRPQQLRPHSGLASGPG